MQRHDVFFFATVGFLGGTIAGGIGMTPVAAIVSIVLASALAFFMPLRFTFVLLVGVFFFTGNVYYAFDDYAYRAKLDVAERSSFFEARVLDEPRRSDVQIARIVATEDTEKGVRLFVRAEPYPELSYGDLVLLTGSVVPPPEDSYGRYMAKERMHGTLFSPDIEIIGNDANPLFEALYSVRRYIKDTATRLFSQREAAFLSGILLGDRDEFSDEFLEKLSVSGTMHLTALSGLHMTIIVFTAIALFSVLFAGRSRLVFFATFTTVALFVAMTGFKVSAMRASFMAFLAGFAKESGRIYSPRNAIAFAALVITLWNPKSPMFDLGFQLSFAATLSIIYFTPALMRLRFFKKRGVLGWRDILAITLAAQIGVLPITIMNFANFSLSALPANVGILLIMPPLMVLGFATVAASAIFPPLATLLQKPTSFLLEYAIQVVDVFSSARIMFNPEIGITGIILYYAILIWLSWRYAPQHA